MKYIWNKTKLLEFLDKWVQLTWLKSWLFFDAFSWTWSVGKFFKSKGFDVISNDLMFYSYVEQKAYIENNENPKYNKLLNYLWIEETTDSLKSIIEYLNLLPWEEWFIFKNYSPGWSSKYSNFKRQYFTDFNAKKIDWLRIKLDDWKNKKLLTDNEYYILLSYIVNEADYLANISWTYWAYLKIWRSVATNNFNLRKKDLIINDTNCLAYNTNTNNLIRNIKNIDIAYFDIPYNQRQYSSNFHILETIAKYDTPEIKWKTWIRIDSSNKSSNYCKKRFVKEEVEDLIKNIDAKYILFSYNSDGLLKYDDLVNIFDKYCVKVDILKKEYRRFKTDNSRLYKNWDNELFEYLFIYKK